ncbi:putative flagellum transition zone component [Trypanosoma conorhini]|uniref:Putative flagellum transition zone component n=1 Tax=Trypanosoma conorhini TaxID=83891 RepID=A0A422P2G4_9TRYP|nr:putative flagellum transition zone component [Trypanosoma conorhini]RNF11889.1 putative flagellum transition zone component [Trypanosoma conorhini]
MDVEDGALLGKQRTEVEKLERSVDSPEPCTVRNPAPTVSHEGEVIDAAMTASLATGPLFLSGRICASSKAKHTTTSRADPPQPHGMHVVDAFTPCNRLGTEGVTPKPRRTRTVSASTKPREVGAPYKESHSKRFRDRVMGARDGLCNDDRVLLLAREKGECMAELREKSVQIKRLEVTVRALRAQLARSTSKIGVPLAEHEKFTDDARVSRLVDENNGLETRLREANAKLSTWKREARVAHLQELKMELAVYKAEVTRLLSTTQGGLERELRRSCIESRLREAVDAAKAKDDVIQELRRKLSENAAAMGRSLESAMLSQSTVDQLQEENRSLCEELHVLRKAAVELTHTREKLECARAELKEARERFHELRRLVGTVGGPAEIFTVIKERDALLNLLKEQNAREEAQRREFARQQADARQSAEKCLQKVLQEERAVAGEKVAQLGHSCMMWKESYERLALGGATERDRLETAMQAEKGRQEERQRDLCLLLSRIPLHSSEQSQPSAAHIPASLEPQPVKALTASARSSSQTGMSSTSTLSKSNSPSSRTNHVGSDDKKGRNSPTGAVQQEGSCRGSINSKAGRGGASSSQQACLEGEDYSNSSRRAKALQGPFTTAASGTSGGDEISTILEKGSPRLPEAEDEVANIESNERGNEQGVPLTPLEVSGAGKPTSVLSLTGNRSALSDTASVPLASADRSSEPSLPIHVQVPPPPPAVVPAPPADSTSSSSSAAADGDTDSEPSLTIRVQRPSTPRSGERSSGNQYRASPVFLVSGFSDVVGDATAEEVRPKNRYQEEDVWETVSAAEDEESFTVHHVGS